MRTSVTITSVLPHNSVYALELLPISVNTEIHEEVATKFMQETIYPDFRKILANGT